MVLPRPLLTSNRQRPSDESVCPTCSELTEHLTRGPAPEAHFSPTHRFRSLQEPISGVCLKTLALPVCCAGPPCSCSRLEAQAKFLVHCLALKSWRQLLRRHRKRWVSVAVHVLLGRAWPQVLICRGAAPRSPRVFLFRHFPNAIPDYRSLSPRASKSGHRRHRHRQPRQRHRLCGGHCFHLCLRTDARWVGCLVPRASQGALNPTHPHCLRRRRQFRRQRRLRWWLHGDLWRCSIQPGL
mmetsp:Transcript_103674/g.334204  ORF Transcript_103674/g.334204 Transcript_103674/m.334204 type:complete len:240 (+) Transcript_103674:680-1399(+)